MELKEKLKQVMDIDRKQDIKLNEEKLKQRDEALEKLNNQRQKEKYHELDGFIELDDDKSEI